MKKIISIFLLLVMLFTFTACDEETDKTPVNPDITDEPEALKYSITWKSDTGQTLSTTEVQEGEYPSYTWDKQDTEEWDYTFLGWSLTQGGSVVNVPKATANATYYAIVTAVKQKYTLSFVTNGGSTIDATTKEYKDTIAEPTKPTYEGHRFLGWYTDSNLTTEVQWPITLTKNTTVYAAWNEQVDMVGYLSTLLAGYELNPYSYIPEAMQPKYEANLVDKNNVITDYSGFVSTSSITSNGFGEQWHMVTDNLSQSQVFFNALSVVEGLTASSIAVFNNYLDQNPASTAQHTFSSGIYQVTISFDGAVIRYVLDYQASIPVLGQQTIQISMAMDVASGQKDVRVQIGEQNALRYRVTENSYEFAIKYLGVREAFFRVEEKANGKVEGSINEYLTVASITTHSSADFYVEGGYVSVVGNKAGGLVGFTGYISELYSAATGKLLGYEVRESLSSVLTYNTLWFDLSSITGINNIKYIEKTDTTDAAFYVNSSSAAWEAKKVGGISLKNQSRRFDIEFRTQYFYTYNADKDSYEEVAVKIPMLFVQEENYATLAADVLSTNSITISMNLSSSIVSKIQSDYDTLVDIFIENKEGITREVIVEFIGEKYTFNA